MAPAGAIPAVIFGVSGKCAETRRLASHLTTLFVFLAAACTGTITEQGADGNGPGGGGKGSGGQGSEPVAKTAGPSTQLRRLTRVEYNNTVRDLLGDTTQPANAFSADEKALGVAIGGKVTNLIGEQCQDAAEKLAKNAVAELGTLLPCDPTSLGEDQCATAFIDDFVPRAFRRPIEDSERTRLVNLYSKVKAKYGFKTGIEIVITATLQSPHFLYLVEPQPPGSGEVALTQHQLASRMSYFLWGSMPDSALFDAANTGSLKGDEVEKQARRMLAHKYATDSVRAFSRQWLELEELDSLHKDTKYYPSFSDHLRDSMSEETERWAAYAFLELGSLDALFTTRETFVNADLAKLYGVPEPASGWKKVTLPKERSGFLTQASFLATKAHPNQTSPIVRGKFVREALFCQLVQPPPPNVEIEIPKPDPNATTKEKFLKHSTDKVCAKCHQLMDPIGFGFENFDGIGAYRTKENNIDIDASGSLVETDVDGDFVGAVELAQRLAKSDLVRDCMTRLWLRYALKRGEDMDEYSVQQARQRFRDSGYDVRELMIAITLSHGFQNRRALEAK